MATDPLIEAIRNRLDLNGHEDWCPFVIHRSCCDGQCECATGPLVGAFHAVLKLDSSASHRQVLLTIARKLGVASEWLGESYEAMPEQMREML